MSIIRWLKNRKWVTLGMKVLLGVTIASNIFIGSLLYFNLRSSQILENTVNEVLDIRTKLSENLRVTVVELQNKFLSLPQFFRINPHENIVKRIEKEFKIVDRQTLKGRDSYSALFSRNERRDITKRQFVVKEESDTLAVFSGIFSDSGEFTDAVEKITIKNDDAAGGAERIKAIISEENGAAGGEEAIKQKIAELGSIVADTGLQAEKTRNEILYHVEQITAMEHKLYETRERQRRLSMVMGAVAIVANMAVLFLLIRIIVERPLHQLTHTIDEIRAGNDPDIPWNNRKDQIGILSGAIINFREALAEIRDENERKKEESIIIEEIFDMINSVVQSLEGRAKELAGFANRLHELASNTGSQAEIVLQRANDTSEHTDRVSDSTATLQKAVEKISSQMKHQGSIAESIIENNRQSHSNVSQLNQSITDINGIISIIREITDQTKLLALNASIEAARAGSSGQGFAVVAGEVKALSMKTQAATKEVMEKVAAIEKAGSVLVSNMHDIDRGVNNLNNVTVSIMNAVDEQKELSMSIAELAGMTSENTKNVSISIEEVSRAASLTRDLSLKVNSYSDDIARELTDLLQNTYEKLRKLSCLSSECLPDLKEAA